MNGIAYVHAYGDVHNTLPRFFHFSSMGGIERDIKVCLHYVD